MIETYGTTKTKVQTWSRNPEGGCCLEYIKASLFVSCLSHCFILNSQSLIWLVYIYNYNFIKVQIPYVLSELWKHWTDLNKCKTPQGKPVIKCQDDNCKFHLSLSLVYSRHVPFSANLYEFMKGKWFTLKFVLNVYFKF